MESNRMYIDRICRTCAEEKQDLVNIFSEVGRDEILVTMFDVQISVEDPLPKNICLDCEQRIKDAFYFKKNCMTSEEFLKKIFQRTIEDLVIIEDTKGLEQAIGHGETYGEEPNPLEELTEPVESHAIVIDDSDDEPHDAKYEDVSDFGESESDTEMESSANPELNFKITQITNKPSKSSPLLHVKTALPFKPFFKKKSTARHNLTGPPYECKHCLKNFSYRNGLVRHLEIHNSNRERRYKCDICTKAFFSSQHLREHYQYIHMGFLKKKFKCDICDSNFKRKSDMKRHVARHNVESNDNSEEVNDNDNDDDDVAPFVVGNSTSSLVSNLSSKIKQLPAENMLQWKLLNEVEEHSIFSSLSKLQGMS